MKRMKHLGVTLALGALALPGLLGLTATGAQAAAASCTATGFVRDGINMTAAQIGGDVTSSLDAGGCNIGVYYGPLYDSPTTYPVTQGSPTGLFASGNVTAGAEIFGANYFGVLVNGDVGTVSVNVTGSRIHDIGETPLNGTQHGTSIYYRAFGGSASGTISGNTLTNYQKGGITVNGNVSATITNNTVTGQGAISYIAQNGIQVGYGAKATVTGNTVTGNAYTGASLDDSAGILVVGGPCFGAGRAYTTGLNITKNTLTNNDVGVWLFNGDGTYPVCTTTTTKTNNTVKFNTITSDAVTNLYGYNVNTPCGYQAGVSDAGVKDLIASNKISGLGYTKQAGGDCTGTPPAFLRFIDVLSKARGVSNNK